MISKSTAKRLEIQRGSLVGEAPPASGSRMLLLGAGGIIVHGVTAPICTVTVPVKTVSELNRHEHWRVRQKRAKAQHAAVAWQMTHRASEGWPNWLKSKFPLHVHLTRLSARKLDTDNLAGALKHCRDAVAKFLGVDDGREDLVSWSVGQEQQKGYAVRCEFYRRASAAEEELAEELEFRKRVPASGRLISASPIKTRREEQTQSHGGVSDRLRGNGQTFKGGPK